MNEVEDGIAALREMLADPSITSDARLSAIDAMEVLHMAARSVEVNFGAPLPESLQGLSAEQHADINALCHRCVLAAMGQYVQAMTIQTVTLALKQSTPTGKRH